MGSTTSALPKPSNHEYHRAAAHHDQGGGGHGAPNLGKRELWRAHVYQKAHDEASECTPEDQEQLPLPTQGQPVGRRPCTGIDHSSSSAGMSREAPESSALRQP